MFKERELREESVVKEFFTTAADGKNYQTRFYNLDVIISVGYRVKSHRGTQFRIWATQRLREYIVKGFTMDDERLKNPPGKGQKDYFDEQPERIRDIRSSVRRFYQKVLDIYATSVDYTPDAATEEGRKRGLGRPFQGLGIGGSNLPRASLANSLCWAVMLWRFQRGNGVAEYPVKTSGDWKKSFAIAPDYFAVGQPAATMAL